MTSLRLAPSTIDEAIIKTRSFFAFRTLAALTFTLIVITGCEDTNIPSVPVISAPSYPQLASIEPPAPQSEDVPILEEPQTTLWKPGYWSYNGSSFEWVPGEIIARPAPTAVWFSSYWARREYGWAFVPGYWQ